jgi:hypothetical protein
MVEAAVVVMLLLLCEHVKRCAPQHHYLLADVYVHLMLARPLLSRSLGHLPVMMYPLQARKKPRSSTKMPPEEAGAH